MAQHGFLPAPLDEALNEQQLPTACLYLYDQHDTLVRQVQPCLSEYSLIQAKVGQYVYPTGQFDYLLYLDGLLPMFYQGKEYSTPVKVWIQKRFPAEPPIAFVVPTNDLQVQPSSSYDASGFVHDSYLEQWVPGASHLFGLLQRLSAKFGEEPPLRQVPSTWTPASSTAASTAATTYGQPPSYPPQSGFTPPYSTARPPTSSTSSAGYGGYGQPPYSQPSSTGVGPYAQPPQPRSSSSSSYQPPAASQAQKAKEEEQLRKAEEESIRQYVRDELRNELKAMRDQKEIQMQDLQEDESALQLGQQQLESFLSSLKGEIMRAKQKLHELKKREEDIDRATQGEQDDLVVDWDEAVQPETPLERQLLNLVADDCAISDVLDQLSTAFDDGQLDLAIYLKNVKHLAKEQFKVRSLIKKARAVGKFPSPS